MIGQTWTVSALSLGFKKSFPLYELHLQVILRLALEFILTITLSNFAYNFHPVHYSYDIFLRGTKISSDLYPKFTW